MSGLGDRNEGPRPGGRGWREPPKVGSVPRSSATTSRAGPGLVEVWIEFVLSRCGRDTAQHTVQYFGKPHARHRAWRDNILPKENWGRSQAQRATNTEGQ